MSEKLLSTRTSKAGQAILDSFDKEDGKALEHFVELAWQLRKDRPFLAEDERALGYLLEVFCRSVQQNLFLDTPFSDELEKEREELLHQIGAGLLKISDSTRLGRITNASESFLNIINSFLGSIERLNKSFIETTIRTKE